MDEKINRLKKEMAHYSCNKISEINEHIKQNPLAFIAGAVGLGVVIGFFMNRFK